MTMHVVLGDGVMPDKELTATLQDMWSKANKEDDPFWFLVQAKAEPSSTDQTLMRWLTDNEIYYETIGDGSDVADIYSEAQNRYAVKRLAPKVVNLMQTTPDEGEEARMLALFAADDPDAEEDRWLNDVIQAVVDGGFKVFALNDGLVEIDLTGGEGATEPTPEPEPVKKAPAKKAAAKPVVEEQGELEMDIANDPLTREGLEELNLDQIKEIASARGISFPPRTRATTYIDALLGENGRPDVEVTEHVTVTGDSLSGAITLTSGQLSGNAMLIVIYDGVVTSRTITTEEAAALVR